MTGGLSTNFHGVGIGPLSNILAVKNRYGTKDSSMATTDTPMLQFRTYIIMLGFWDDVFMFSLFMRNPK